MMMDDNPSEVLGVREGRQGQGEISGVNFQVLWTFFSGTTWSN